MPREAPAAMLARRMRLMRPATSNGRNIYFDATTIVNDGPRRKLWYRPISAPPRAAP